MLEEHEILLESLYISFNIVILLCGSRSVLDDINRTLLMGTDLDTEDTDNIVAHQRFERLAYAWD
jgi:hypothetical protein